MGGLICVFVFNDLPPWRSYGCDLDLGFPNLPALEFQVYLNGYHGDTRPWITICQFGDHEICDLGSRCVLSEICGDENEVYTYIYI